MKEVGEEGLREPPPGGLRPRKGSSGPSGNYRAKAGPQGHPTSPRDRPALVTPLMWPCIPPPALSSAGEVGRELPQSKQVD